MQVFASITTAGGGAGSGNATTELVRGFIESVIITESGGSGATVTITEVDPQNVNRQIAAYTGNGGEIHPAAKLVDNTGAAISNSFRPFWIAGYPLKIAVTSATATTIAVRIDVSPDSAFVS